MLSALGTINKRAQICGPAPVDPRLGLDEMGQVGWPGLLCLAASDFFLISINVFFFKNSIIFTLISLLSLILFREPFLNDDDDFFVMHLIFEEVFSDSSMIVFCINELYFLK
jgi:hypothetical protein